MTLSMSNKLDESASSLSTSSLLYVGMGPQELYSLQQQEHQQQLQHVYSSQSQGHGRETIHSGQFMVSHFEAEAQDEDDSEIKMPDPEDPSLEKTNDPSLCTVVQRYVPQSVSHIGCAVKVTSRVEIETTLAKLFKCLNLAYSQKLTSPKWNHFKGVRLRWKDKIRLNNVIWRCWHMQFILKKKTKVCQFASPLDVDIHINPQTVVLEGKYWKRQVSVIKAEYSKWRRNFKTKAIGHYSCCDSEFVIENRQKLFQKSELDLLDWSPLSNDKNLMITEDWTSDTLFSAINEPFPFPDPREIARGAGIADFIQPSLGPLQPNLDDIDLTFQELLQNHRLPPVPEEITEDLFKNSDYNFGAIMGSEQMDSATITDVTNSEQQTDLIVEDMDDANMLDLNASLNSYSYSDVKLFTQSNDVQQQSQLSHQRQQTQHQQQQQQQNQQLSQQIMQSQVGVLSPQDATTLQNLCNQAAATFENTTLIDTSQNNRLLLQQQKVSEISSNPMTMGNLRLTNIIGNNNDSTIPLTIQNQNQNQIGNYIGKNILKGRVSKPMSRPFRREPHNYDKAQPTSHQTIIYQKMLAEQQQKQQPLFIQSFNNLNAINSTSFHIAQQPNIMGQSSVTDAGKNFSLAQGMQPMTIINTKLSPISAQSTDLMTLLNVNNIGQDTLKVSSVHQVNSPVVSNNTFQPYPTTQQFKKAASTAGYLNISPQTMHMSTSTGISDSQQNLLIIDKQQQQQQHQQTATHQLTSAKEMYRSNSLPLNSSLQKFQHKDETFAIPKLHVKPNRSRSRSNSIQQQSSLVVPLQSPQLQSATSEPMLNSTLAQLLVGPNSTPKLASKHRASTSAIPSTHSLPPSGFNPNHNLQIQQQHQQQHQQQLPSSIRQHVSPTRTQSLPHSMVIHSPPGNQMVNFNSPNPTPSLSPDSFAEQDSPLSPTRTNSGSNQKYTKDHPQRRAGHIHAEKKRRYNIKNGFDTLHSLIPQLQQNPNTKLSKAAMLQKGAEYIKQLRTERNHLKEQMTALRNERDNLNISLAHLHSVLSANGAPVLPQRTERVQQLYTQYVHYRTSMDNWKFWILGLILEPLHASFMAKVSVTSIEELSRTALNWVDQHCSLVELRPAVTNKLRYLSTTTDILSDPPSTLQEEVLRALSNQNGQHPNLNSSQSNQ